MRSKTAAVSWVSVFELHELRAEKKRVSGPVRHQAEDFKVVMTYLIHLIGIAASAQSLGLPSRL